MTQPQELSTMSLLPILSETPVTLNSFPRRLGNLSIRVGPPSQMIGWKKKNKKKNIIFLNFSRFLSRVKIKKT